MKTTRSICLGLLLVTGATSVARSASPRTDINPALHYYQAFLVAADFSEADRDYLFTSEWRGQKLPPRFGDLVARYDNQFKLVRQAARSTAPCDWGIDMTPGPATLLPHLARCKAIAQAARLRVLWDLQNGRQAEARDDLLATFALGRHSSRDGTLISALVQVAMENIVCSIVAESFHQFSAETLQQLSAGFDAAPPRGAMAACVPVEKTFFLDWMTARVRELQKENPGNDAKVMAGIRQMVTDMENPEEGSTHQPPVNRWEQVLEASAGTSEGVLNLLRDMAQIYQKLAVILALPPSDYEIQAKQLGTEIEAAANPLIALTFPAFDKCRQKEFAVLAELAMVRAAVEYKLRGESGLRSVADPCGQGPFAFRRFIFEGVDRGFELRSAYAARGFPEVLIFVEKEGPPFRVNWKNAGQPIPR